MIILCGPSACGKTEVAKLLNEKYLIKKVVTTTTREKRVNEIDGVDYFFLTEEEFLRRKELNLFVETACYNNKYYGCLKSEVGDNKVVILEPIGVKNFLKLNQNNLCVFYLDALESIRVDRMRYRKDTIENIKKRINNDRISFSKGNLPPYSYKIDTSNKTIEEVTDEVFKLYQQFIKKD